MRYIGGTGTGALVALNPAVQSAMSINTPQSVWVDWNGNVYVADQRAPSDLMVRIPAGTAGWPPDPSTETQVGANLVTPIDLTVDGAGNVYIVDAGTAGADNGQVVMVPNENGTLNSTDQVVLLNNSNSNITGVDYGQPKAITVNSLGYLFVAYPQQVVVGAVQQRCPERCRSVCSGQRVYEYRWRRTGSQGNLYVADTGSGWVVKVPETNSNYNPATHLNIGSFSQPTGVSVDAAGNVYVTDAGNARVMMVPYENGNYAGRQ